MDFLLYPNPISDLAAATADLIAARLGERGHRCRFHPESGGSFDMMIVVGGDGTVLRAVRDHPGGHFPIWAVNAGHVGYLTDVNAAGALDALDAVLDGQVNVVSRMVLEGMLDGAEGPRPFFCLNEFTVHRAACLHSVHISLSVDRKDILHFTGDGVLVATPTGSTAYNLSLGGPVLLPDSDDLVITPICPHSAIGVPIVVPGRSRIRMTVNPYGKDSDDADAQPCLTADGALSFPLAPGDTVEASAGSWTVPFVHTRDESFYRRLRLRMMGGEADA